MEYPQDLNALPPFSEWLENVVQAGNEVFADDVVDLSMLPTLRVQSFNSMKAYGNHFQVCSGESNLVTMNSDITVTCETVQQSSVSDSNPVLGKVTYFGKVVEILELDYGRLKSILLLCDWIAPIWRGPTASLNKNKYGFTLIKLSRLMRHSGNSFVFPLQASQIYFLDSADEPNWSTIVHTNPRSIRTY